MAHLTATAFIGYGYVLFFEEVDIDKYENDLYNTDMLFKLDCTNDYESPWFYGIELKSVDLDYDLENESKLVANPLAVEPEVIATVKSSFAEDFPELNTKVANVRLLSHIWW